jgi:hypothetical protein
MSQSWRTTVLSGSLVVLLGGWGAMGVLSRRPDLNSILAARQLFTWMKVDGRIIWVASPEGRHR